MLAPSIPLESYPGSIAGKERIISFIKVKMRLVSEFLIEHSSPQRRGERNDSRCLGCAGMSLTNRENKASLTHWEWEARTEQTPLPPPPFHPHPNIPISRATWEVIGMAVTLGTVLGGPVRAVCPDKFSFSSRLSQGGLPGTRSRTELWVATQAVLGREGNSLGPDHDVQDLGEVHRGILGSPHSRASLFRWLC